MIDPDDVTIPGVVVRECGGRRLWAMRRRRIDHHAQFSHEAWTVGLDLSEIAERAVAVPRPERLHPATIDDVDMIDMKTYAARENISRQAAMKRLDRGKVRGPQDANGKWWLAS